MDSATVDVMPRIRAKIFNKSDFVRSMLGRPAKEVVELAARRGMKLTERYVYVIRSADKSKARDRGVHRAGSASEAALRSAIAELGLGEARRILAEVEAAFGGGSTPARSASPVVSRSYGAKSAFILNMPAGLPATAVVAAAAEKGMRISTNYVYRIRSDNK